MCFVPVLGSLRVDFQPWKDRKPTPPPVSAKWSAKDVLFFLKTVKMRREFVQDSWKMIFYCNYTHDRDAETDSLLTSGPQNSNSIQISEFQRTLWDQIKWELLEQYDAEKIVSLVLRKMRCTGLDSGRKMRVFPEKQGDGALTYALNSVTDSVGVGEGSQRLSSSEGK